MARVLIVLGVLLVAAGLAWPWLARWAGHLPGDIVVHRGNFTFHAPIVTCLAISAVLTLAFWIFRR